MFETHDIQNVTEIVLKVVLNTINLTSSFLKDLTGFINIHYIEIKDTTVTAYSVSSLD